MGTAHRVVSACLRVLEFCCSAIILGLLARFFYLIDQLDGPTDSRLIFALSMAAISVFFTLILLPPVKYSFYCFPIDFSIFVCWIVCFSLLQDLTGTNTCQSGWFTSYWTVYWSGTGSHSIVTTPGCSQWRVVLAFSFSGAFVWLLSGFLGLYACLAYHKLDEHTVKLVRKMMWWKKPKPGDLEHANGNGAEKPVDRLLPKVGDHPGNGVSEGGTV